MSDYFSGIELVELAVTLQKVKEEIGKLRWENEQLKEENKKLKAMLKKCSPMKVIAYSEIEEECYSCGAESENEHFDDCEYVKLIGGTE